MTNLSHYKGAEAIVASFTISDAFLVIRVVPQNEAGLLPVIIMCYFCEALPCIDSWTVDDLQIYKLEGDRTLLADWEPSVFVPCYTALVREDFDLHHYLATGNFGPPQRH